MCFTKTKHIHFMAQYDSEKSRTGKTPSQSSTAHKSKVNVGLRYFRICQLNYRI